MARVLTSEEIAKWLPLVLTWSLASMKAVWRHGEPGHPALQKPLCDYFTARYRDLGGFKRVKRRRR